MQQKWQKVLKILWKLKSTQLNINYTKEEIKKELKIFLELDEIENITCQNLWTTWKLPVY